MALVAASFNEIVVGDRLAHSLYDEKGRLLLREGAFITTQRQRDALMMRGVFRYKDTADTKSASAQPVPQTDPIYDDYAYPFERIDALIQRLSVAFSGLQQGSEQAAQSIVELAGVLQRLYKQHPDAMLGAVHLTHEYDYTLCHPVHCAILAQMMAVALGYEAERQESLIAAALTQNIAMMRLQEELQKQEAPLTDEQRREVHAHPERAVAMLRAAGVTDELWLQIIMQHHEKPDGSGYPNQLSGDEVLEEAQLLALADRYAASISARSYRDGMQPREGLRTIYMAQDKICRADLAQRFIKEIGVYPPGSFVKLVNGETAVVIRRGGPLQPTVASYIGPRGAPLMRAFRRDTSRDNYRIVDSVWPDPSIQINLTSVWVY